jgi:hypothetical protein
VSAASVEGPADRYFFSTRVAVIAVEFVLVSSTSTVMSLTTPAHVVSSNRVIAVVVTVVVPTLNENGHA